MFQIKFEVFNEPLDTWQHITTIDTVGMEQRRWYQFGIPPVTDEKNSGIHPRYANREHYPYLRFTVLGTLPYPLDFEFKIPDKGHLIVIDDAEVDIPITVPNSLSKFNKPSWGWIILDNMRGATPDYVATPRVYADNVIIDPITGLDPDINDVQMALEALLAMVAQGVSLPGLTVIDYEDLSVQLDGMEDTFTVESGEYVPGSLKVWRNGQLLTRDGVIPADYLELVPLAGTFRTNFTIGANEKLIVSYRR